MKAPWRDVVEIREMEGERGGTLYVMQLSCGCLIWGRRARRRVRCIPCWWRQGGRAVVPDSPA
ncbi:MAG: hypothetical protein MJE77_25940 [Proteobacteria bacterium]|nr:hypothetical protein [Pseudomonadota bacterium]